MSLIDRLIARAQRTPYTNLEIPKGVPYMDRWWLVPYVTAGSASAEGCGRVSWRRPVARVLQALGIAVRIHEIRASDKGRDPHDHPWPYITVVLRGGYWEWRYDTGGVLRSVKWHGPGSVLFRRATDLHKLVLPRVYGMDIEASATTLFITGRYKQGWGFVLRTGQKVPHREYVR